MILRIKVLDGRFILLIQDLSRKTFKIYVNVIILHTVPSYIIQQLTS